VSAERPVVLVVEDEGIVATHIQVSLEELGYAVPEIAASGEEALRLARALRPNLVLMDILLDGDLDGIDTATALRLELGVPVVFLTANSDEPTLARAREAAPYGYLLKPFNHRELRSTIEIALHRHNLEEQGKKSAASARLAAIGTLAAGIAHEVNNPLSWVTANVSYVRDVLGEHQGTPLPPEEAREVKAALGEASAGAVQVARVLRGLRIFARGVDEVPEDTARLELDPLVERVLGGLAVGGARLHLELGGAPAVVANEERLGEVLHHLVRNALQAQAREIRVATRGDARGRAVLEVRDDGVGMSPETRGRLFDPFFTTKGPSGGSGLGLTLCHGIITALGGSMEVESQLGSGSAFRVLLPAAEPKAPAT
jgi:signal transduction histidine kinase